MNDSSATTIFIVLNYFVKSVSHLQQSYRWKCF